VRDRIRDLEKNAARWKKPSSVMLNLSYQELLEQ
jgi:hypothetical protein